MVGYRSKCPIEGTKTGEGIMSSLGLFIANFGAYLILFLLFAACAFAAAIAGIVVRKRKNAKDAVADGEVAESEA